MAQSKTMNKVVQEAEKAKIKSDAEAISEDVRTLRSDVASFLSSKMDDGKAAAQDLKETAKDNLVQLKGYGRNQLKSVEEEIRQKPGRSVLIAAGVGLLAGMLFSRRR